MHLVEILLAALVTVVVVLAARPLADKSGVNAALILTLVGLGLSFIPGIHFPELDPELILVVFLPPILYAAAVNSSVADFWAERRSIISLSVGLVIATAAAIGLVAWWLLPVGFFAAFALGSVIGPPDAVAAIAIGQKVGLPRRIMTRLEGESLLNDATALVLLTTAIAAIEQGNPTAGQVGLSFLISVVGGAGIGFVVGFVVNKIHKFTHDGVVSIGLSLITPWLAFLPAEEVHASGVLAVVVSGLAIGHRRHEFQSASARLAQNVNWGTISFLLENSVFFIIGLQAHNIITTVFEAGHGTWQTLLVCLAVYATTLLVRFLWMFAPVLDRRKRFTRLSWQQKSVLAFAGMRGVVTLAGVFLIPEGVPYRDVLVLAALFVTLMSLMAQGLSMPWVVEKLQVRGPGAQSETLQEAAILTRLGDVANGKLAQLTAAEEMPHNDVQANVIERLGSLSDLRTRGVWERLGRDTEQEAPSHLYRRYRLAMLEAQRREALIMRNERSMDYEVLQRVLGSLDVEQATLEAAEQSSHDLEDAEGLHEGHEVCEHIDSSYRNDVAPASDHCLDCERDGLTPIHLRLCTTCGYIGCCDSSPGRHATKHFEETGHPVIRSYEPGEAWRWCNVDALLG